MVLYKLLHEVDIQSEYTVCVYDYELDERIENLPEKEFADCTVRYLYIENGKLYIELDEDGYKEVMEEKSYY